MSYTEIYAFGKDGNAYLAGEVHNAWRGPWLSGRRWKSDTFLSSMTTG